MDEPKPPTSENPSPPTGHWLQSALPKASEPAELARGSGHLAEAERTEHSIMEGLPTAKAERVAPMRREVADLQQQLIAAQQRIATELQGRADDAERLEALEQRLQTHEREAQQGHSPTMEIRVRFKSLFILTQTQTAPWKPASRAPPPEWQSLRKFPVRP